MYIITFTITSKGSDIITLCPKQDLRANGHVILPNFHHIHRLILLRLLLFILSFDAKLVLTEYWLMKLPAEHQ